MPAIVDMAEAEVRDELARLRVAYKIALIGLNTIRDTAEREPGMGPDHWVTRCAEDTLAQARKL